MVTLVLTSWSQSDGRRQPRYDERHQVLDDHVRVTGATHEHGMLHIDLLRETPEALKPRRIEIARTASQTPVLEAKAETVN